QPCRLVQQLFRRRIVEHRVPRPRLRPQRDDERLSISGGTRTRDQNRNLICVSSGIADDSPICRFRFQHKILGLSIHSCRPDRLRPRGLTIVPIPRAEENSQMTTDGTSSTPESPRPSPGAFNPEVDYPDPRSDQQRADEQPSAAAQSAALTDSGGNPHGYLDQMIEGIREAGLGVLEWQSEDPPIQFDVWRDPGRGDPDQPDMGIVILVARGEMLLRVPPGGLPSPEEAATAGGTAEASEIQPPCRQADPQLREPRSTP